MNKRTEKINYQHRMSSHPLYHTWENMRQRCNNPKHTAYKWYGARGIKICERWNNFKYFIDDVGEKPSDKHTLDRINNNGNYEPGNIQWSTQKEQLRNQKIRSSNTTGFKGVWYNKKIGNYQVFIRDNYKGFYVGSFYDLDEAIGARLTAEAEYWG